MIKGVSNTGSLKLPVVEEFYSLQGEGFHTGKAAYFVRIGGCDIGCRWCDSAFTWDPSVFPEKEIESIIENALKYPGRAAVITGGEPLMWNLNYLCDLLKSNGFETFLETSGAYPLSGNWDWICLSPKKQAPPLPELYPLADELKVIIADQDDFDRAVENASLVREDCHLFLQPEWSVHKTITPVIVEFIKQHPEWSISLQAHKFMKIP